MNRNTFLLAAAVLGGMARPSAAASLSSRWCEERTINEIKICWTLSARRHAKTYPLERFYLEIPGRPPLDLPVHVPDEGIGGEDRNKVLEGRGGADAVFMRSLGTSRTGEIIAIEVSWSYFNLDDNVSMNAYVRSIRDMAAGGKELLDPKGVKAVRMKAVPEFPEWTRIQTASRKSFLPLIGERARAKVQALLVEPNFW